MKSDFTNVNNALIDDIYNIQNALKSTFLLDTSYTPTLTKGSYISASTGKTASNGRYARTGYFSGSGKRIAVVLNSDVYVMGVFFYDNTINISTGAGYLGYSGAYRSGTIYIPKEAVKVVVSFRRADSEVLSDDDVAAISSALSLYKATDPLFYAEGVPADAEATGDRLSANEILTDEIYSMVNYGYSTPIDHASTPGSSDWDKIIDIKRINNLVTLTKSVQSTYAIRLKISNSFAQAASNAVVDAWTTDTVTFEAGHKYVIQCRLVGGSSSIAGKINAAVPVHVYPSGRHATVGEEIIGEKTYYRAFTAVTDVSYNIALYLVGSGDGDVTFTNAKYLITMEDVTAGQSWDSAETTIKAINNAVNFSHNYINYNYETPYLQVAEPGASWDKTIGVSRNNTRVILNLASTISTSARIKLSGDIDLAGNNAQVAAWESGISLKGGHTYVAINKLVGGSMVYNGTDGTRVPSVSVYPVGSSTGSVDYYDREDYICRSYFTVDADGEFNIALFISANAYTFNNAVFCVLLQDITAVGRDGVPSYYFDNNYIGGKVDTINTISLDIGRQSVRTVFLTDYHRERNSKKSPSLVEYIADKTGIKNVVFGGDAYDHDYTSKLGAVNLLCSFLDDFKKVRNSTNMYFITGNHEWNNADVSHEEVQIPNAVVYNLYNEPNWYKIHQLSTFPHDTNSFYVDDSAAKIRMYFIDAMRGGDIPVWTIHDACVSMQEVPEGYAVVIFSHAGFYRDTSTTPSTLRIMTRFEQLLACAAAMNDGGTISDSITVGQTTISWSCDFTNKARTFIGAFTGDRHIDYYEIYDDRFPVVITTWDGGAYDNDATARVANTTTEQAFDVIQIDIASKHIFMTRIGYGDDREFTFGDGAGVVT